MNIQKIEISQGRDGLWYVVATTPSGLCHDSFILKVAAFDFAATFYGVMSAMGYYSQYPNVEKVVFEG